MIKPTVLLLFVLGISGYSILTHWHKTHFSLQRSSGYHTFFKSTLLGLIIFGLTALVYLAIVMIGKHFQVTFDLGYWFLENAFLLKNIDTETVALFDISILTFLFSIILPRVYYLFKNRAGLLKDEFLKDADSPDFSRLFGYSIKKGLPVLFTMSDRKVYIGYIYEAQAKVDTSDVYILPVLSGYRSDTDLALIKVTPYEDVVSLINEQNKVDATNKLIEGGLSSEQAKTALVKEPDLYESWYQFIVGLPLREIVHAHLHDLTHEDAFKNEELKVKPKIIRVKNMSSVKSEFYSQ
ncbi:hypothetical protein [Pseudoalteromonas sp. SR44-2]|uniref:hypothetical protein n=1 Tax=Pseudoalteromonas sp. SR44-2 TaxID=2760937 RepID=UPI001601BF6D|nr:hypothetical protein [Pseudoalteromonas sp. SR44-2]MBB1338217.1 hypothetical protein [Pseudoalteromonas sp. SR44-2]